MLGLLIGLRNLVSRLMGNTYKRTKWQPELPLSIGSLREFVISNYKWTSDSIYGLLDHILPVAHMNWQLETTGFIRGDCDDFATYTSYLLIRMGYTHVYRVNIIDQKHVVCVFMDHNREFRVFSNSNFHGSLAWNVEGAISNYCDDCTMIDIKSEVANGAKYDNVEIKKRIIKGRSQMLNVEPMMKVKFI